MDDGWVGGWGRMSFRLWRDGLRALVISRVWGRREFASARGVRVFFGSAALEVRGECCARL